jgi:hypothetical protein
LTPKEIKALGKVWGAQDGLLSVAEIEVLMSAVRCSDARTVLEVGHYCGLSTCAIVHALWQTGNDWELFTVDAHIADQWVERPASVETFEGNFAAYFHDARVTPVYLRSQTIDRIDADFVFYDGDHGEEQLRFARAVIGSSNVQNFLFDDSDFDFPRACCDELRAAGWDELSPILRRLPADKMNPETQTLAWFKRH